MQPTFGEETSPSGCSPGIPVKRRFPTFAPLAILPNRHTAHGRYMETHTHSMWLPCVSSVSRKNAHWRARCSMVRDPAPWIPCTDRVPPRVRASRVVLGCVRAMATVGLVIRIKSHRPNLLGAHPRGPSQPSPSDGKPFTGLFGYNGTEGSASPHISSDLAVPGMKQGDRTWATSRSSPDDPGLTCLAGHPNDVQACSAPSDTFSPYRIQPMSSDQQPTHSNGARYINTIAVVLLHRTALLSSISTVYIEINSTSIRSGPFISRTYLPTQSVFRTSYLRRTAGSVRATARLVTPRLVTLNESSPPPQTAVVRPLRPSPPRCSLVPRSARLAGLRPRPAGPLPRAWRPACRSMPSTIPLLSGVTNRGRPLAIVGSIPTSKVFERLRSSCSPPQRGLSVLSEGPPGGAGRGRAAPGRATAAG